MQGTRLFTPAGWIAFLVVGLVLVMLLGVAVAEGAGLIPAAMRGLALVVPDRFIIPALFALAACGNIGSDAGIVVIPPLAAAIFRQLGKSPIAGLLVGWTEAGEEVSTEATTAEVVGAPDIEPELFAAVDAYMTTIPEGFNSAGDAAKFQEAAEGSPERLHLAVALLPVDEGHL